MMRAQLGFEAIVESDELSMQRHDSKEQTKYDPNVA